MRQSDSAFSFIPNVWLLRVVLPLVVMTLVVLNISLGSVSIPFEDVLSILTGGEAEKETWKNILVNFRLPKMFTALVVGAGLAVSGLLMQTLFNNPLAGPFVLGITSGASLGVALLFLAGSIFSSALLHMGAISNWMVVIAGSIGAGSVMMIVMLVSIRIKNSMTLLIVGLLFGSTTSALVSILQFFSSKEELQTYIFWTFGSLGGLTWVELKVLIPVVFVGLLITYILRKPLNAMLLGETYAGSVGVNIKKTRYLIILSTSLMAGSITAFCGPIAFIGIAVPHMARMLFNSGNQQTLVTGSVLVGIIVLLVCDIISQIPGSQYVIPINAITSLIGAPVVIWMVLMKKEISKSFM